MGQRHLLRIACAMLMLCAAWSAAPSHAAAPHVQPLGPLPMWTRIWQTPVRAAPNGELLSLLDIDQEVRVTGATTTAGGVPWRRVLLWGALTGWIAGSLLAPAPIVLGYSPGGVPVAPQPVGPHAPMPLHARAVTSAFARLRAFPDAGAPLLRTLRPGVPLAVTRWATDAGGLAWYGVHTARLTGWIYAGNVDLLPAACCRAGLAPVRGLGMWCTPAVLQAAPPWALVEAARRNGITHLYIEVASSSSGDFYGGPLLDALLPVAHRAHIAVLAWVFPFLDDLPHDVATALEAARYVAPSGDRPDGLVADIEQNMQDPFVRAYSQIVRARLGPHVLMAAATYPPQSYWGGRYPFRTVARSWDVILPMDYWHVRPHAYSASDVYQYVQRSIQDIRKASGRPTVPIEVLGQMFDVYGNGRHSPSAAEIAAAIRAARDEHAIGISFFEWNHATPEEWDVLHTLVWEKRPAQSVPKATP